MVSKWFQNGFKMVLNGFKMVNETIGQIHLKDTLD